MEARLTRSIWSVAVVVLLGQCTPVVAQFAPQRPFVAQSQNFIVFASSPQWATEVSENAERLRSELAQRWLGQELPAWQERCPIHVTAGPNLGAGGETRFSLLPQGAGNWMMNVQGSPERVLDSVLPHEISHTIFATYFAPLGKYVPRWADEGACTTVEHESEKRKHRGHLTNFLKTGRGLAFNQMFQLKEYPDPILPLYAQGHSVVQFLIDQGGTQKFIQFIKTGMQTESWDRALQQYYAYRSIGEFQTLWNKWLLDGSPNDLSKYAPGWNRGPQTLLAFDEQSGQPGEGRIRFAGGSRQDVEASLGNDSWYKRRLQRVSRDRAAGRVSNPDTSLLDETNDRISDNAVAKSSQVMPAAQSPSQISESDGAPHAVILHAGVSTPIRMVPIQR